MDSREGLCGRQFNLGLVSTRQVPGTVPVFSTVCITSLNLGDSLEMGFTAGSVTLAPALSADYAIWLLRFEVLVNSSLNDAFRPLGPER